MKFQAVLFAAAAAVVSACPAVPPPGWTPPKPQEPTTTTTAISSSTVIPVVVVPEPTTTAEPQTVTEQPTVPTTTSTTIAPLLTFPPSDTTLVVSIVPKPTAALTTSIAATTTTTASNSGSSDSPTGDSSDDDTSSGSSDLGGSEVSGESTFYGGNLSGGMCSFTTYTLPSGLFGTAFSGSAWDDAANCGSCVEVTGPNGNSITAMIVDQCPECDEGHLDLFQNAFEELGAISAGIIETSYKFVSCGITSPITLHNKSGTSAYWFSIQVVNSNVPIKSLEVSTDGGSTWQSTTRAEYNFFENQSGFGTSSVDIKITSTTGKTIVVNDVSVSSDSETTADSNF